jgi:hypothetical protein
VLVVVNSADWNQNYNCLSRAIVLRIALGLHTAKRQASFYFEGIEKSSRLPKDGLDVGGVN